MKQDTPGYTLDSHNLCQHTVIVSQCKGGIRAINTKYNHDWVMWKQWGTRYHLCWWDYRIKDQLSRFVSSPAPTERKSDYSKLLWLLLLVVCRLDNITMFHARSPFILTWDGILIVSSKNSPWDWLIRNSEKYYQTFIFFHLTQNIQPFCCQVAEEKEAG